MNHINNTNAAGTTVTIKTVDNIEHFKQHNQRSLHCIQNNQYPNIRCVLQVRKEKENETNTFFNKKTWYNLYNTLYYLNQDI
ncbi:hypothetical protein EKK58_03130 [Candidatus Dependentiae bacterium]|nr:MAG: hypothetical protein EKK58_03130 [Candidatus Dependentiae bacterium]